MYTYGHRPASDVEGIDKKPPPPARSDRWGRFISCIAIYPQGLTVKLNDGRTGIVSNYNFNAVGRPQIRIIKDEDDQEVKPYEIDLLTNENLTVEIVEADALLSDWLGV